MMHRTLAYLRFWRYHLRNYLKPTPENVLLWIIVLPIVTIFYLCWHTMLLIERVRR